MEEQPRSPRISHFAWGRLQLEGGERFKDAKLYPGGARAWDWRETEPGTCRASSPPTSRRSSSPAPRSWCCPGALLEALQVCPETLALLKHRGIPAHVRQTEAAIRLYNQLAVEHSVGLFHSTC